MNDYIELINKKLDEFIPVKYPEEIFNSMRYSVLAGGKRLRPIMVLEACKMFGGDINNAIPTACAIEMLHTQSLIHDDLPCMDNDDYRRGKLTNHKMFSESTAVLAGDALLSFAPQIIIKNPVNNSQEVILKVLNEFFESAGAYGIIAGQIVDIDSENKKIDFETLKFIHKYKTAHLFKCALRCGAIIGKATQTQLEIISEFADEFGLAFQIYDDLLDSVATYEEIGKTPNKDINSGKATYVTFFGEEEAKKKLNSHCNKACDILKQSGLKSDILFDFTNKINKRFN